MEPSNSRVSFMQQMLRNKFLLLTVFLGALVVIYFGVGLVVLLDH